MRASIAATYPGLPPLRMILTGRTDVNALDLADYTANLPAGCALWRATGGPLAWTDELHFLSRVLHSLDLLIWQNTGIMTRNPKGAQPKPVQPPELAGVVKAKSSLLDSKRKNREIRRGVREKMRATE